MEKAKEINYKDIFIAIAYRIENRVRIFPTHAINELKRELEKNKLYSQELGALTLIEESIKIKRAKIESRITRLENTRYKSNKADYYDKYFNTNKVRKWCEENKDKYQPGSVYTLEDILAQKYYEFFLK